MKPSLHVRTLVLALLVLFPLASPRSAVGTGRISDGKLDLLVYFAYAEPDPTSWEPLFEAYSALLLEATEGGLQLGTVSFTVCPDLSDRADLWILNDSSGARSHLNGLGVLGRHMTISQLHKSTGGFARGQFGLVHEAGHYLWGVYDEYRGFIGNGFGSSGFHYCASDAGTVACFMDGGTTIFPNYLRTEFCTRTTDGFPGSAHFRGLNDPFGQAIRTDQEYYQGRSCWEQIERSGVGALDHPTSAPTATAPLADPVTFDYSRLAGDLALCLVIDTSGSMSAEGRLEQAVLAAQAGIGLLRDGEILSIVSFGASASVLLPATVIGPGVREQANALLDGLVAGGGTVLGPAVQLAVDQLGNVSGCEEFVVVVTDGASGAPDIDDPAVVAELLDNGHRVFGLAVGSFPTEAALNLVSDRTGGSFSSVRDPTALPGALTTIFASASAGTAVGEAFEAQLEAGAAGEETFFVAPQASVLRLSLTFAAGQDLELVLVDPRGERIDASSPPAGVEVRRTDVGATVTIPGPRPGAWRVEIRSPLMAPATYDLLALVDAPELQVEVDANSERFDYPAPMALSVSVVAAVPVAEADVRARVLRPDGSEVELRFFDDGLAVHGDEKSGDGVYSALFTRYAGDGAYTFVVTILAEDAVAASNQECGAYGVGEDGQSFDPIPPFEACVRHTLLLAGQVPGAPARLDVFPHAALEVPEEVELAAAAPTPVAGFGLAVAGSEPVWLRALRLRLVSSGGSSARLERLALRPDDDGDGLPDGPPAPLALARVEGGDLVFAPAGGDLALLAPGTVRRYLVTAGDRLPDTKPEGDAGLGGGFLGPGWPSGPGPRAYMAVLLGLLAALLLLALGWFARGRSVVARTACGLTLGAMAAFAAVSCSGSGGGGSGAVEFVLEPAGIEAESGLTGDPLTVLGGAETFSFTLR